MFYERFSDLCQQKGVSPSTAAREIGLSNSIITYWKRGASPKSDTAQKIAMYFGVSVDSLFGKDKTENSSMGERIQKAREAANLTQKELADKVDISLSLIEQYESNARNPKTDTLFKIAEALNVNPKDLGHIGVFFFNDYTFLDSEENPVIVQQGSYLTRTEVPLVSAFRKLNDNGKKKAVERVEELTEIQKYQARKEKYSDALGDVMADTPDIRDDFITWMMAFPDEALPVIAKYLQDVAKDPEAYLKCSDAERQKKTAKFAEDVATAIKEAEQKNS